MFTMKINSTISPNFKARHIDLKKADDIARHVNHSFPMFKPTYAMHNWKILNTSQNGKNDLRVDFYKKYNSRVMAMRDEYMTDISDLPYEIELLNYVDRNKTGNCYESAMITLGTLFANGFEKSKKISPRVKIVGFNKHTQQAVISKSFPIDHTCVITSMNNPKREDIDHSIIIDSWLNKAMTIQEAKEEYKKLISKRDLASGLYEIQQELKFKLGRKRDGDRYVVNHDFNINDYEFKYFIHFVSDQDFTKGEIEEFSSEIKKKYPRLIMDYFA